MHSAVESAMPRLLPLIGRRTKGFIRRAASTTTGGDGAAEGAGGYLELTITTVAAIDCRWWRRSYSRARNCR